MGYIHNALELGGREGGLSLWLALKGKEVFCSDLKDVKFTAEPLHIRHEVNKLITYRDIDATNIPYNNHFDIIVFKSILGGIGSHDKKELQKKVFKEIHKALKPGGKLLFAENLIASPLHRQLRKMFVSWGETWRYISLKEIHEFLHEYKSFSLKATGVLAAFGRNESQRNFLSGMDDFLSNKICPDNWKYIVYGIAEK
jgi:SAM-dependent methyltransferase